MHAPRKFRKAFMAQLLVSLRAAGQASKSMGLRERRDAVRLSSDVAMALASARARAAPRSSAAWARALVARHAAERRNEALMRRIMGGAGYEMAAAAAAARSRKEARSRRIVRRSRRVCSGTAGRRRRLSLAASGGAGRCSAMVKARLQVLRSLVPGGEALRGLSLLSETLDYVVCLKTQVELMQCLCKGSRPKLG
ncbi:transcription factor IBH1-like [Panicum miliaceum]|uniref:Transcription factor IBH1-like n=1 Tax=Panicum miliaceum TaxID=4540 RepID=A0A3L6RP75_PANMI|nr:transcription factor IBH1-like [Panicum miliaceum]